MSKKANLLPLCPWGHALQSQSNCCVYKSLDGPNQPYYDRELYSDAKSSGFYPRAEQWNSIKKLQYLFFTLRRFFKAHPSCKHFCVVVVVCHFDKNVLYCNISSVSFASPVLSSSILSNLAQPCQILSNLVKSCHILSNPANLVKSC